MAAIFRWLGILFCATTLFAQQEVKFGYILPLTGNNAFLGEGLQKGIELRLEEQKRAPGRFTYNVIYEDDWLEPHQTALALQKLINIDHVKIIGSFGSGCGAVVVPVAERNKILHLGITFSPLVSAGSMNFSHWPSAKSACMMMVKALQRLGIKRVAIISAHEAGTDPLEQIFREICKDYGIEMVGLQKFNIGERDFRVSLLKLRETKPDILFIHGIMPEVPIILRQKREIAWDVPFAAISHFGVVESELLKNTFYVESALPTEEFRQKFKARWGVEPGLGVPNAYDNVDLVIQLCENYEGKEPPSSEWMAGALSQLKNYQGATGSLTVDARGVIGSPDQLMWIDERGQRIKVSEGALAEKWGKLKEIRK